MNVWKCVGSLLLMLLPAGARAQENDGVYSRGNTFEVFASGAYTSSHILLGSSRNRQLAGLGFGYARRVLHGRAVDLSYLAEFRPVLFESDPFVHVLTRYDFPPYTADSRYVSDESFREAQKCVPSSGSYVIAYLYSPPIYVDYVAGCGRERTFAQGFSPLGFKLSGRTSHRVQPTLAGTLGYVYSNKAIPVDSSGSFNFAFDFGPGVEFYREKGRSVAFEYRFHHISNHYTAAENPGVDMMMMKVSYNFGR